MTREAFEREVSAILDAFPEPFRTRVAGVVVQVQDRPARDDLKAVGVRTGSLFGLFQGTPLTEESIQDLPRLPARILIFQRELEDAFPDPLVLKAELRKTVLHELGHYFGLSERELGRLGYR